MYALPRGQSHFSSIIKYIAKIEMHISEVSIGVCTQLYGIADLIFFLSVISLTLCYVFVFSFLIPCLESWGFSFPLSSVHLPWLHLYLELGSQKTDIKKAVGICLTLLSLQLLREERSPPPPSFDTCSAIWVPSVYCTICAELLRAGEGVQGN